MPNKKIKKKGSSKTNIPIDKAVKKQLLGPDADDIGKIFKKYGPNNPNEQ
tara:strand:- start:392 stop:541 length:150 start_codon:yes stop_codon:yes gene_type:complete